ncbi:hypothetical protein [Roseovarius sp. EL26]|uniref:hypothetical protein n=1 Tax=Roseovarius sp. EL26 TaxID=2126672 RepID=UPI000EA2D95B|nr:hypothetical protein [Roseovarius sp. EL26]
MQENYLALQCKSCHLKISKPVRIYEAGVNGAIEPEFCDGLHVIQNGFAYKSVRPYRTDSSSKKDKLDFVPQYWMTIQDVLPEVTLTMDLARLNGCCGLDGCDGPNRVCSCGAEVGTEMSDCWTSHLFIPDPGQTNWVLV